MSTAAGSPTCSFVALDFETTGLSPTADRIIEVGAIRFDFAPVVLDSAAGPLVPLEGTARSTFHSLVDPERSVPAASRAVHGLADADLAGAPAEAEVLAALLAFLLACPHPTVLVAHHAPFDVGFLRAALQRQGYPGVGLSYGPSLSARRRASSPPVAHLVTGVRPGAGTHADPVPPVRWETFCTKVAAQQVWPSADRAAHRLATLSQRFGLDAGDQHRALADAQRCRAVFGRVRGRCWG